MSDVEFFGERFELAHPEQYQVGMLDFAEAASGGIDDGTLEALAAVKQLLRQALVDFDGFWRVARAERAQVKRDLMPVVVAAFRQEVPEVPTVRPADSSGGPQATPPLSVSEPVAPVLPPLSLVQRLEQAGRPDKAEFVVMAERARASAG